MLSPFLPVSSFNCNQLITVDCNPGLQPYTKFKSFESTLIETSSDKSNGMKQNTQIRWELVNTGENTNNCWLCRVCNETESHLERLIFQI